MPYVLIYLIAIVVANLVITTFGPSASVITAFVFIGLDLTLRDRLHDLWSGKNLALKMGALILVGSAISYAINAEAGRIALASALAFGLAALADTGVYDRLRALPFLKKANGSNLAGAAVDSLVFPVLAFGGFLWPIILGQFVAKVAGGFLWSLVIDRLRVRHVVVAALLLVGLSVQAQPTVLVMAHYDVAREAPIASVVYSAPVAPKVFVTGFVETWRNTSSGYPAGEFSVFSKHWASYGLTPRLSLSLEVEVLYNRAGVAFRFPEPMDFVPGERKVYITPKVGASYRIY